MKHLVLGFDAGCMTCSELARRIEEEVGDKLELRNLHDPQVEQWRKQALGKDAPWAPTLIEVSDEVVKAWTGWRLAAHMSRALGPIATWQVMEVLGEAGAVSRTQQLAANGGMSRGRFLKGLAGAMIGVSVLSGVGPLSSSVAAAEGQAHRSVRLKELKGRRLIRAVNKAAEHADVKIVMPDGGAEMAHHDGTGAKAGIHTLENGDKMLVVAAPLADDRALLYYETRKKRVKRGQDKKTLINREANVWRADGEGVVLENASHNGEPFESVSSSPGSETTYSAQARRCGGCKAAPGIRDDKYLGRKCKRVKVWCATRVCIGCSICGGPIRCLICLGFICPFAIATCCKRYGRGCKGCPTTL